ncbi:hypothetical protein [Streptomyces sp. MP131-18]|uniref:hypothetical protein n=1 Tax=Streptomyces sp. MP131-18 TaxID=1857892 RepID=UPI00097C57E7|nr:hypothetical protein [Streptomyces sp. MP131-18]ONK14205.1 Aldo/keto reductase family protein [Streptomyces sp. MP131-18]
MRYIGPTHHEPTHHEPTHHEPTHHEPTHHEPTHHEPTHHEPTHHEPAHHEPAHYDIMADRVRRAELDFIQVHYSVRTCEAGARLLPACADNGDAVTVNMPLEKGRLLHHVVGDRPLPRCATELGVHNWAQCFLKWVVSHPAVTCALPATSGPAHLLENGGTRRGELPDGATRRPTVREPAHLPGFEDIPTSPWYPGTSYPGLIGDAAARMRERSPWRPPAPAT